MAQPLVKSPDSWREVRWAGHLSRMTATDIARIFRVSNRAVGQWKCPRNDDNSFDLREVVCWKIEQIQRSTEKPLRVDEELKNERRRREKVKADREEGLVVPVETVYRDWTRLLTSFKQRLLTLGASMAARLEGQDARSIANTIDEEMRRALTELAEGYRNE